MARSKRTTKRTAPPKAAPTAKGTGADTARIRRHLQSHGLGLQVVDGKRCLVRADESGEPKPVATPSRIRSWANALAAALALHLCPAMNTIPEPTYAPTHQIETADGEPPIQLTEYQMAVMREQSRVTVLCWCRQAGKDFTASLKAVLDAIETGQSWYIVSLTQRQALATAKKAQMHAKAILGVLSEIDEAEQWVNDVRITSYGLKLPNGAEIVALPGRDPDALAGLTGNVIFTEMALFPENGEKHWRVVFPLATRGFKVWAISTPRGPQTKFSELRRNAQGMYAVHNLTIHDAVERGLKLRDENGDPMEIEQLRKLYGDESGWSREYLCIEGDDHDPLINWMDIHDCADGDDILTIEIKGNKESRLQDLREQFDEQDTGLWRKLTSTWKGTPVVGWDIAVAGDFSSVTLGEKLGQDVFLRALVIMHGVEDFDYQEEVVTRVMETGATGQGDASGLGREACQRIGKRFGEHRWAGVVFNASTKTPLFTQLRSEMQSRRLHYPASDLIKYDLHALGKRGLGVAGKILRVETNRNTLDTRSHADIATAIALMVDAAQGTNTGPIFGETVGRANQDGSDYNQRGLSPDHADDYATADQRFAY